MRWIERACLLCLALMFGAAIGSGCSQSSNTGGTGGSGALGGQNAGSGGAAGALGATGGTPGSAGQMGSGGATATGGAIGTGGSGGTSGGAGKTGSGGSAGDSGAAAVACQNVQASCNLGPASTPPVKGCVDYSGVDSATLSTLQTNCESTLLGTWSSSPCDTTGAAGGCLSSGGPACSIKWIPSSEVAGVPLATLQQECGSESWVSLH
jgi:hypothetical protein